VTAFLYVVIYLGLFTFLAGSTARAVRYSRLPGHLRWELYPVPHEEPGRVRHGGSYFETADWWTREPHFSLSGELKAMIPEMLFLKGLWEFNRKLWYRSFLFHFGLYLLAGAAVLLLAAVLGSLAAPGLMAGAAGGALHALYTAAGMCGAAMAILGAAALLHRRLTHPDLKNYTAPADLFNLAFFIVTLVLLAGGYLMRRPGAPGAAALLRGMLTFDATVAVPGVLAPGLVLAALLAAYIPFTHMSHFVAKYFTYHHIRWDDLPAGKSAEIQRRFAEYLTFRPTWAAQHIGADGIKTWADIAAASPFAPSGKGAAK